MRNDIWLFYYCPKDWRTESPIEITAGISQYCIIPDADFTIEGKMFILEVDHTQSMQKNKEKIGVYSKISPLLKSHYGQVPVILFYTISFSRKQKLKEYCAEKGVQCRVFTKEDLV